MQYLNLNFQSFFQELAVLSLNAYFHIWDVETFSKVSQSFINDIVLYSVSEPLLTVIPELTRFGGRGAPKFFIGGGGEKKKIMGGLTLKIWTIVLGTGQQNLKAQANWLSVVLSETRFSLQ